MAGLELYVWLTCGYHQALELNWKLDIVWILKRTIGFVLVLMQVCVICVLFEAEV